jgi:hypothetical protein
MKVALNTIIAILVLSLIAWSIFYYLSMPLEPEETVIVVAIAGALVYIVKRLIAMGRMKGGQK